MTDRELMQQALDVLEDIFGKNKIDVGVINRLRDRLAQPVQDPVAWMNPSWIDPDTRGWASDSFESIQIAGWVPLYTAPRQWQGLTDEEVSKLIDNEIGFNSCWGPEEQFARAIEAKLKEKNT